MFVRVRCMVKSLHGNYAEISKDTERVISLGDVHQGSKTLVKFLHLILAYDT